MDDLIHYLAGEIYFANTDWPSNNLKMYKISGSKKKVTGWKFAFFDLDYGFGYTGKKSVETNMFQYLLNREDPFSLLFRKLMGVKEFRILLKEELEKLFNETLSQPHILKMISNMELQFSGAMERHTARWRKPENMEEWENEVEKLREFAEKRQSIMVEQMKIYLR